MCSIHGSLHGSGQSLYLIHIKLAIQKLKERILQLDLENKTLALAASSRSPLDSHGEESSLDVNVLKDKMEKLKRLLQVAARKSQVTLDVEKLCDLEITPSSEAADGEKATALYYQQELKQLKEEFERYKMRAQVVLKSKNVKDGNLGKELEEYAPELSAQVDVKKNILGQTSVLISGYQKTAAVEPYYAEADSQLFQRLQEIIDGNLVLDDLKCDVVEVKLWDTAADGSYPAIREECYIEVTGYGGDNTGYQIPFTLHYTGKKVPGMFHPGDKAFMPN